MNERAKDPTLELLQKKIWQQIADASDNLVSDNCKSFEEYKHHTGIIQGLLRAERELLDLDEKMFVED